MRCLPQQAARSRPFVLSYYGTYAAVFVEGGGERTVPEQKMRSQIGCFTSFLSAAVENQRFDFFLYF